jgi:excisionase family DNA binding protein
MPEPLLTTSEVAKLLRLSVETVYTLIAMKGLPVAKIGSQWRFEESRVRAWVEAWIGSHCALSFGLAMIAGSFSAMV